MARTVRATKGTKVVAKQVNGASRLADELKHAAARKGWKQTELEWRSRETMSADGHEGRSRIGLSERTWQEIWQGRKTYEMELYSYVAIDRTLGWIPGTAWALHHDQEPPMIGDDDQEEIQAQLSELQAAQEQADQERALIREELIELRSTVRGLTELLPSILGRIGRSDTAK